MSRKIDLNNETNAMSDGEIIFNIDVMLAKRKMSLTELAEKVGITIANMSILKTGKAKAVKISTLIKMCEALECQPGDLLEYRSGRYEFRNIRYDGDSAQNDVQNEIAYAVMIEQICFPPNEACSEKHMRDRITVASDLFLVAIDRQTGMIAGFLNGIATDESRFRDEFFTDAALHNPKGKNVMILGLDVLPAYRMQGLGRELVRRYLVREKERGRKEVFLTCLDSKVAMYEKFGFTDLGLSGSTWGGEEWHEMSVKL